MIFEIENVDFGVLGDRDCIFETRVMVEGHPDAFPTVTVIIEKMEVWNENRQCVVDMTHWLDTPKIRQRLETMLEEEHEANLHFEAKFGEMEKPA